MSTSDQIQRFIFDDLNIRGVIVGLETSYADALKHSHYEESVKRQLGEMLVSAALLSSTLKFEGRLSLQAQGEGAVSLLMAECTQHQQLRGVARVHDSVEMFELAQLKSFADLMSNGTLALTVDPVKGQRYQGIVPLEKETLSTCLQDYFYQSEQLPTRIYLAADAEKAAGILLQILPGSDESSLDWEHIVTLADTLSTSELLALDNEELLYRLFSQEQCRVFPPLPLQFQCECTRERCWNALQLLGKEELQSVLDEQSGQLQVDCDFCNQRYQFDTDDIHTLLANLRSENDYLH